MGWRAVRGVPLSGSGGLLCPRLITGMCGGRGEDEEEDGGSDAVEVVGGRGHGGVLAGAGSRGGGEERMGDLFPEAACAAVDAGPPRASSSSSVSMAASADVASISAC